MGSTFARVLLFRHLAICVSALMAYLLRQELTVGYAVLAVVAGSAVVNFGLFLMRLSERAEPIAGRSSPGSVPISSSGASSPSLPRS